MKLSTIRRILKEDLARSGEVASWVDQLLSPLNEFIDQAVQALRNNLTFKDNFACKVVERDIESAVSYEINPQSRFKVSAVQVQDAGGALVTGFGWARLENGSVEVKVTFTNKVDGAAVSGSLPMSFAIFF